MDLYTLGTFPGDIPTIDLSYVTLTDKFDLHEGAYYLKFSGNTGIRLWLPSDLTSITDWTGWCFRALCLKLTKNPQVFQEISLRRARHRLLGRVEQIRRSHWRVRR
ncbi:hypothetical protein Droror1_Dr00002266 [Drosera rotundifolia]